MKTLFVVLIGMISATVCRADILYFDLNFSVKELAYIRKYAAEKNERLLIYPERTPEWEAKASPLWMKAEELKEEFANCITHNGKDCDRYGQRVQQAMAVVNELVKEIKPIEMDTLNELFTDLEKKGVSISTFVISGHSGGIFFTGLLGTTAMVAIKAISDLHPSVLGSTKMLLIWGCYAGTFNYLNNNWKKNFPQFRGLAGYRSRSPLGIRESSGKFLYSMLAHQSALLAAKSLEETHKVFKTIDLVAELDGTAEVGDYYMTYDEADSIPDMMKRCEQFPEPLYIKFLCYSTGDVGCENPPPDHEGPLRDFYTFMQVNRHCTDLLKDKYPDLPAPEYIIRLIYIDTIKKNFVDHHQDEFKEYVSFYSAAKFSNVLSPAELAVEPRSEYMKRFMASLKEFNRRGLRDGSITEDPLLKPMEHLFFGLNSLNELFVTPAVAKDEQNCVPFSWVEPGAKEEDTCMFSLAAHDPIPKPVEDNMKAEIASLRITNMLLSTDPLFTTELPHVLEKMKSAYVAALAGKIEMYENADDRSPQEDRLLPLYKKMLADCAGWSDLDTVDHLLAEDRQFLAWFDEELKTPDLSDAEKIVLSASQGAFVGMEKMLVKMRDGGQPVESAPVVQALRLFPLDFVRQAVNL